MGGYYNNKADGGVIIYEDGVASADPATSIDFTGAGVSVTEIGGAVTVDIPGGGSLTRESLIGTINDVNVIFTVSNEPKLLTVNGLVQTIDVDYSVSGSYTITFLLRPPEVGDNLQSYY